MGAEQGFLTAAIGYVAFAAGFLAWTLGATSWASSFFGTGRFLLRRLQPQPIQIRRDQPRARKGSR